MFFLAGAAKQKCLEVYKAYSRDREEVMQGTKDKGAPLKIQMCKCIVKLVKEQAVPYPACKEGGRQTVDYGWLLYRPRKRRGEPSADFGCQPFGALVQGVRRDLATCGERHGEGVKQLQSCPGCLSKGKEREKAVYYLRILLKDFSVCARKTLWRIFCVVSCW